MKQITLSILCCLLVHTAALSQSQMTTIKGKITAENTQKVLVGSTIVLNNSNFGITDKKGNFEFKEIAGKQLLIKISNVGFKDTLFVFKPDLKKSENLIPTVKLKKQLVKLNQVVVNGEAVQMIRKGDTLQYNAAAVKLHSNATAKELVDAIPGMTRDSENKLHHNGKKIQMVMVDGQLFFRDAVDATLEALPAEIVQNVQVYDDLNDLAKFTGFDDGNRSTILNLVTKYKNLKFGTGRYEAGMGTDNRYELEMNNSFLLNKSRLNINGKLNNLGRIGDNEFGDAKVTYNWKDKHTSFLADYNYKWLDKDVTNKSSQIFFNEDRQITRDSRDHSFSYTHQANSRIESKLGKRNKIYFEPEFRSVRSNSKSISHEMQTLDGGLINNSQINAYKQSEDKSIGGILKWQTILSKRLYLETELYGERSESDKDINTSGSINDEAFSEFQRWENENDRVDLRTKLIYMRSKQTGFTLEHSMGYKGEESAKDDSPLALNYLKNRTTVGFMFKDDRMNTYSFDIGHEQTKSVKSLLNKDYNSLVGSFSYRKRTDKWMLNSSVSRKASTPSLYQVYDFFDASIPLQVKLGNPNLKQSYNNNFSVGFAKRKYGHLSLRLITADNYITQNTFISDGTAYEGRILAKGTQVTEYDNVNGYYNLIADFSLYKLPFGIIPNLSYNYSRIPSLYNSVKNISKQNSLGISFYKGEHRNKDYYYTLSGSTTLNWSNNSSSNRDNHYLTSTIYSRFKYHDFKKFSLNLSYDYHYYYQPLQENKHQHSHKLDLSIGRKFYHDKFEVFIKARDILNQNKLRTTQFQNAYTHTNESNGLRQYFMLSLKFNFSSLGKGGYTLGNHGRYRDKSF